MSAPPKSPLHGGVDRNVKRQTGVDNPDCRPFTGAWIETPQPLPLLIWQDVAPSRGRGSKHGLRS